MMEDKSLSKSHFYMDKKLYPMFKKMTNEQKGILIDAIYEYEVNRDVIIIRDALVSFAFDFIMESLKQNNKKYNEACQRKEEAVKKRWSKNNKEIKKEVKEETKKETNRRVIKSVVDMKQERESDL